MYPRHRRIASRVARKLEQRKMKERILKDQHMPYMKHCAMASIAAIAAMNELETEGLYTDENNEVLWRTAWSTADFALVVEDAELEEATWLATQAARRHALAIPGGVTRYKYIKAGRITPAWRVQLAQLAQ